MKTLPQQGFGGSDVSAMLRPSRPSSIEAFSRGHSMRSHCKDRGFMSRRQRSEAPLTVERECGGRRGNLKLLGSAAHFGKHRLGYLDVRQLQSVGNADDAAVFGFDAHHRLDRKL